MCLCPGNGIDDDVRNLWERKCKWHGHEKALSRFVERARTHNEWFKSVRKTKENVVYGRYNADMAKFSYKI